MLTKRQGQLFDFIVSYGERGVSPSFREMQEALGLKSKSGIHRLITGLEERGFIKRLAHRARAIEVIRTPGANEAPAAERTITLTRVESIIDDLMIGAFAANDTEMCAALRRLKSLLPRHAA